MLGRQERIALVLLVGVALAVVTAHAVLSMIGKQPFSRPFTENTLDGELVSVEGRVKRATLLENGGHLTLLVGNITVFVPASSAQGLAVHKNDTVFVYGVVQTYRGKKEVVVNSAEDIRITAIP